MIAGSGHFWIFHIINRDLSPKWPTEKNCHRMLNISVQRTNVQRNGVQSIPCTVHRGERTHWHQVFILWDVFITGSSVTEKSFWQVWLPVRFSGIWAGGNLRIFCTLTGYNDHCLALRECRVQICLLTILFPVSSLHRYIYLISRGPYIQ